MNRRSTYLIITAILLIFIIVTVFNIFNALRQYGIENIQAADMRMTDEINTHIGGKIDKAVSDSRFLAEFMSRSLVTNFQPGADYDNNLKRVEDVFLSFTEINDLYNQVRFIDINGNEVIRVNNDDTKPELAPMGDLQNKADRPYFSNTIRQREDNVYISPIDLSVEHGKIEIPADPVVRVGVPVYNLSDSLCGVVILNISGDRLLKFLDDYKDISVINQNGMYIYNRDSSKEWGSILGTGEGFQKDFSADTMSKIAETGNGYMEEKGKLITFSRFDVGNELWYIIHSNDIAAVSRPYDTLRRALIVIIVTGFAVAVFLLRLFLREYRRAVTSEKLEEVNSMLIAKQSELEADYALVEELNAQLDEQTISLMKQRDITLAVVNSVEDYIVLFREDGSISANSKAREIFGINSVKVDRRDLIERLFSSFTPEGLADELLKLLDDRSSSMEKEVYMADKSLYFNLYSVPVRMAGGEYIGRLTVLHDITKEKEVDRLKSELISTVSHELRTPMSSIMGFAELLATRILSEEKRKEYISIILSEARRLTQLINDFLDIQRMESGRQTYRFEKLDMASVAEETIKVFRESSGRNIMYKTSGSIPPVYGDRDRLKQVLYNLLSNAVKYSQEGEITVELKNDGTMVRCSVSDNGIGISEKDREKIFQKFFRVNNEDTREIGGTGLGLAICKEIITAHGGDMWFTSEIGKGSTFSFTIPVYRSKGEMENE